MPAAGMLAAERRSPPAVHLCVCVACEKETQSAAGHKGTTSLPAADSLLAQQLTVPLSLCVPLAHSSYSLLRAGPALAQGSATAPGLPRAAGLLALPSALLRLATKAWLAGEGDCGWWADSGASQPPTRIGHSRARSSVLTRPLTAANCRKRARS